MTTTILRTSPETVEPDFTILVDTSIPIYEGKGKSGGSELFPGPVVQVIPQFGGSAVSVLAKPLKLGGAAPPLRLFSVVHCALQNVTLVPIGAFRSPMSKAPTARNAKIIVFALADDGR